MSSVHEIACQEADVERARHEHPEGATCHFCRQPNHHADDMGWWYIHDTREISDHTKAPYVAACESCCNLYHGPFAGER